MHQAVLYIFTCCRLTHLLYIYIYIYKVSSFAVECKYMSWSLPVFFPESFHHFLMHLLYFKKLSIVTQQLRCVDHLLFHLRSFVSRNFLDLLQS